MKTQTGKSSGFTLVEILTVIAPSLPANQGANKDNVLNWAN
jgi:hypothetical protein